MNKKIKSLMPWICTIVSAALGIGAFFLVFAPSVRYDVSILGESVFKGLNVALGYTKGKIIVFSASIGMILAYVFPLLGAATAVIGKDSCIARTVATALLLVGGVLSFFATTLVNANFGEAASLALGSIFSGVLAILGAVAEAATFLPCVTKDH